ncbi:hypothetical protein [Psychromonas algicola]|uniref:hypothetical protein n=1 Tax=Psychromonas algicola TaxID=2555642 RepID=UPI0014195D70|nr:hypothetical protein [Psychromonas sp. RZ5]
MKNMNMMFDSVVLTFTLTGCVVTSNLTEDQKADLVSYQTQLAKVCVEYEK